MRGEAVMKRIDFEAHFVTKDYVKTMIENEEYPRYVENKQTKKRQAYCTPDVCEPLGDLVLNRLLDLGEERLKDMDAAGVDVQVLSLNAPGVELFDASTGTALAKKTNDELSDVIKKYPDRFLGSAAIAPRKPEAATDELERAVKDLGFKGWKTHSNYGGTYLDDERYWPILQKAEELEAPIYLHPAVPAIPQMRKYGIVLAGAPFGFGAETALCMMRLIFGGVFDRYPGLKIVLGHLGEGLPFLLKRIDFAYERPSWSDVRPKLGRKPSEYFKENVFVATSGNYFQPAFMCTYEAMGIERMLLATDYPFEDPNECIKFLEGLPISQEDKDKIYFLNARQIGVTL
jgi:hypothetical protein